MPHPLAWVAAGVPVCHSSKLIATSVNTKVQYGFYTGHFCSTLPYPLASILVDDRLYWHCQYANILSSKTWSIPQQRYWDTLPVLNCKEIQLRLPKLRIILVTCLQYTGEVFECNNILARVSATVYWLQVVRASMQNASDIPTARRCTICIQVSICLFLHSL